MSGSLAGAFAAYTGPQRKPVIDRSLLSEMGDVAVMENQACARKVAIAASIWDSCINQTILVGEHITDAGNYAASEIAAVLGCSKTVADTYSEIGMDLRLRFPAIRRAFESGEIDLPRVRAIYRVTGPYSVEAVERTEAEILSAAVRLSPGPLATEIDAIMHRRAPEEAAELRKDLTRLTGVRYRDKDMIATIEANLEAADAAASWQLINEMADTLCPRDPRTRGQRRAAGYTALMRGETYVPCTCEADDDHPCTANPALPDRRQPLTNITIDIDTLLGLADLPAYLAGHGDIDADYARELIENSDVQILLTEALDLARALGHITGVHTDSAAGPLDSSTSTVETAATAPASAAEGRNNGDEDKGDEDKGDEDKGDEEAEGTGAREGTDRESKDRKGDEGDRISDDKPAEDADRAPGSKTYPTAHLTFHPLGRGRRRRGMKLPKPGPSTTRTRTNANSGPHEGRYTLIAALEKAIAANPALAVAPYPDGHGGHNGHDTPPLGALTYRPGAQLSEFVRQRDRTCRHPGCDVPAAGCEIDHVIPYNHRNPAGGGWTILTNLHCLCKYHHSLKTMGAWTATMLAGAMDYWTSSSGTTAITLPGSITGTADFAEESLIPLVPRKRGAKCATKAEAGPERAADPVSAAPCETQSSTSDATCTTGSGEAAGTESGGGGIRVPRTPVRLPPPVECTIAMGMSIGLTVGKEIARQRAGAPF